MITQNDLRKISKNKSPKVNLLDAIVVIADQFKPHQLAHVLAQVMHESGGLFYDRELWGPTDAQKRYEGRKDLGNIKPGDGPLFKGYGPLQLTGRANVTEFYRWCLDRGLNPPNFIEHPELIATSPWAGWSIVWYWSTRNLNRYADSNDIEMITRKVNGGLNGYEDRLNYYDRAALVMLGYEPTDIRGLQSSAGLAVDGISGPQTRAAMHRRLVDLTPGQAARPEVKAAPVVEEKVVETTVEKPVPVPVTPPSLEKPWWQSKEVVGPVLTGGIFGSIGTFFEKFGGIPFENLALLLVFGVVALVAVLLFLRRRDQKSVAKQIEGMG